MGKLTNTISIKQMLNDPKFSFLLFFGFSFICACFIIFSVKYPPLIDLPNHMARYVLEAQFLSGKEPPDYFQIQYQLMPNLGMDLIAPFLLMLMQPILAAKIILIFSILLFWLGATFYILQANAYKPHAFLSSLLLLPYILNYYFFMGFINYYSGLGLAFLVLVHFRYYWYKPKIQIIDLVLHTSFVFVLFLWHLADWAIYGLIMLSHVLVDSIKQYSLTHEFKPIIWRAFVAALPGMLTCGLLFGDIFHDYVSYEIVWGTWQEKIKLIINQFGIYNNLLDGISFFIWCAAIGFLKGEKFCQKNDIIHYLVIVIFFILSFLIPVLIANEYGSDSRMWPPIFVCMISVLASFHTKDSKIALGLLFFCLCMRYLSITIAWHKYDNNLKLKEQSFVQFKPNARVLPVRFPDLTDIYHPEAHFLSWAVINRGIFIPSLFNYPKAPNPLQVKYNPPWGSTIYQKNKDGWQINNVLIKKNYDFIWLINPLHEKHQIFSSEFKLIYSNGSDLYLYKVNEHVN